MPTTNLACNGRILRRIADKLDLELNPLLVEQGLDPAKIDEPSARFPSVALSEVWARAA